MAKRTTITRNVVQEVVNRNENLPATEAIKITTMSTLTSTITITTINNNDNNTDNYYAACFIRASLPLSPLGCYWPGSCHHYASWCTGLFIIWGCLVSLCGGESLRASEEYTLTTSALNSLLQVRALVLLRGSRASREHRLCVLSLLTETRECLHVIHVLCNL